MIAPETQQEIERTREHLGERVNEPAAKANVKAWAAEVRAKAEDKAAEVSGRVRRSQVVQRHWPLAVAAGGQVVGSAVIWRRHRT